ncbi:MAG: hypothetical protein IIB61_05610 [Planctomycetes bacterium]|nr:hypothetical protein [Planctomycetota bacterium]MCH8252247.1 hypothetical protein [Planctomycetota bacterium]
MLGSRNRRRWIWTPARKLVAFLLAISAMSVLLPATCTGRLMSLAQVLVPLQDGVGRGADLLAGGGANGEKPVSAVEYRAQMLRQAALEHQVASLTLQAEDLARENQILTAIRGGEFGGAGVGAGGRLLPARVVGSDIVAWRASRLINTGRLSGVRSGAPVMTREFTIDWGEADGVAAGMPVLRAESLIGLIDEHIGTHTARVKLLSDVDSQMKVRIGGFVDGEFLVLPEAYWLIGRGRGVMEIHGVDRRDVASDVLGAGDIVLTDPEGDLLPAAVTIGRVVKVEPDRDNPLLSTLTVRGFVDERAIRRVYVYDSGEGGE